MIFRVSKNKNYTVMSNYHLRDKNISLKAKGLLSWMLSNDNDWDYSINGIVSNCKESETAIESALAELKDFGYLEITKLMPNQTDSGRIEYVYNVFEQPKQEGGFLPLESQEVENPVQRNTIARSTKRRINTIPKGIVREDPSTKETSSDNVSDYERHMYTEEKPKKKSRWDRCVDMIDEYTDDEELRGALKAFLSDRLAMKDKPIYPNQWKALLKKLTAIGGNTKAVVQQSIEYGYASFYPLRRNTRITSTPLSNFGESEVNQTVKVTKEQREEMLKNGEVY